MLLAFISFALVIGGMALGVKRWCDATRIKCRLCNTEVAIIRDCGLYMCKQCARKLHDGCCDVCVGKSLGMMCEICQEFITDTYLKRNQKHKNQTANFQ